MSLVSYPTWTNIAINCGAGGALGATIGALTTHNRYTFFIESGIALACILVASFAIFTRRNSRKRTTSRNDGRE